jgi:predicted regulator of Ras-like GTPase activity (Roadblock/LC7/MglB family)
MGFREHLQEVCGRVEGAIACSLMGADGIEVDTLVNEERDFDFRTVLVEYSGILRNVRDAAESNQLGEVAEVSIATERLLAVARVVSPEYFLVVALTPDGNFGKARYYLRITAPKLLAEL